MSYRTVAMKVNIVRNVSFFTVHRRGTIYLFLCDASNMGAKCCSLKGKTNFVCCRVSPPFISSFTDFQMAYLLELIQKFLELPWF